MGSFFELKPRSKYLVPKVSASISSVAVPNARSIFTRAAHYASASHGASTTGVPMSLSIFLASSIISDVTLTDLPAIYFALSQSPASSAFFLSSAAASFFSYLSFNSSAFISGGFPSNTQTGLIPFSKNYMFL